MKRIAIVFLLASLMIPLLVAQSQQTQQQEAELIRETERERLRALVDADMEAAERLHADDFRMLVPGGILFSKASYLEEIASGEIDYLVWEADNIEVRLYGEAAVIHYRSDIEVAFGGNVLPSQTFWYTHVYERRDGHWRIVWSQATN